MSADEDRSSDSERPSGELTEQRFEHKYRLDLLEYFRVRNSLLPYMRHDDFSLAGRDRRYFVRSLYFDTHDYSAYDEKMAGVSNRIKLRIRSYWAERTEAKFVKLELKTKHANLVNKFAEVVPVEEYEHFIAHRRFSALSSPVSDEFRRIALLRDVRPCLLVDYDREALVPRDGGDVRITFDHRVRFASSRTLFPQSAFVRVARPRVVVLEIKTRDERPSWLDDVARRHELQSLPNSKFAIGIEHTQHPVTR